MKFSIFLPMRSGSTRAPRKNTRPFLDSGDSLFQNKMKSLVMLCERSDVIEIIISSNDEEVLSQAAPYLSEKIKIDKRPDELCMSNTKVVDLINYVPAVTSGQHILWLHVTSPFINFDDYDSALNIYIEEVLTKKTHDSIMSVNKLQQFIWSDYDKKVINVNREKNPWPNTQDLDPLYEINHAFYISSKSSYKKLNDRIGVNPYLYICDGIKKIDIDWEEDFRLAQKVARDS